MRPPIGRERVAQSDIGDGGDAEKPPSAPARRGTGAPGAAPRGALRPPGLLPRAARQVSSTFRSKLRPLSALGPVPQGTAGQGRAGRRGWQRRGRGTERPLRTVALQVEESVPYCGRHGDGPKTVSRRSRQRARGFGGLCSHGVKKPNLLLVAVGAVNTVRGIAASVSA